MLNAWLNHSFNMSFENQAEFKLEPQLSPRDVEALPDVLNQTLKGTETTIEQLDRNTIEVAIRGGGVTSTFVVDLLELQATLDSEKSRDLFADNDDYTDISARPLESAEDFHKNRKEALQKALSELVDPSLIEPA